MPQNLSLNELLIKISEAYKDAESKMGQCNVLVIGKTGVGKSTLINAVFQERLAETGVGRPITQSIRQYTKENCPITVYDTLGLELDEDRVKKVQFEVNKLIEDQRMLPAKDHIHVIWYCINHETGRFEEIEEEWLKELVHKEVPVILVLTQAISIDDEENSSDFLKWLENKNLPVSYVVPVLAEDKKVGKFNIESYGLERLVEATFQMLPEVAQKAFIKEQIASIKLKSEAAFKCVSDYVRNSALIGASPIPFSDAFLLIPMQTIMLAQITVIFGLPFDKAFISGVLSSIGGAGGMAAAGRFIVTNVLKLIPGAGTVLGGAISAATAATLTMALGLAYIELLKVYLQAQISGTSLSMGDLTPLFGEFYKDYAMSGRQTLKDDEPVPREIDIE